MIFFQWSKCLESIRCFNETIGNERDWLKKIHGFQLIRPNSSLFDTQLVELRQNLFVELRHQFLASRSLARRLKTDESQLISSIDLNEFGPLISAETNELRQITNQFDPPSINSMAKLCHLQLDETIHLIEIHRFDSFWNLFNYENELRSSIERIRRSKKNCSTFIDVFPSGKSTRLTSSFFLLRSAAERLIEMKENDDFQRLINDLKTVIYSLEALTNKSTRKVDETPNSTIDFNANSPTEISVRHRFDDDLVESIDEILVGETGCESDEKSTKFFTSNEFDDHQEKFLREQTRCLMKELENAIEGKKNEWTEREKRLFGEQPVTEVETKVPQVKVETEVIVRPIRPISMLDELKETFSVKKQIDEETFGENDDED